MADVQVKEACYYCFRVFLIAFCRKVILGQDGNCKEKNEKSTLHYRVQQAEKVKSFFEKKLNILYLKLLTYKIYCVRILNAIFDCINIAAVLEIGNSIMDDIL